MSIPFNIFPVGPDKAPLLKGWQQRATRDPATIAQWEAMGARAWGIPTGAQNGLFVIDLDVDKTTGEAIGEASLAAQPRYSALIERANVTTPSGGRHIYLQHFDGARNTTSKLGAKIDTRGTGGYVVAPGSVTAGGTYTGHFPELAPVPIGLRALLMQHPQQGSLFAQRWEGRETPTGEVEELLGYIPPDVSYLDWLAVLMALHDRYGGGGEGLTLAEQWSAGGAKYRQGEVARKWQSFNGSGVNWPTIPAMAQQYGADLSDIARRWAA